MRAVRINQPGGPQNLRLEEIATPTPGANEVLVKVAVAGINFADVMSMFGPPPGIDPKNNPHPVTFPNTPGFEVAGTIAALGTGVTGWREGTRVAAIVETGGYAEYAVVPTSRLIELPESISYEDATAGLLVQGQTVYGLLHEAIRLQPGESILIEAAAGGVGSLAVQMAKIAGAAKVIGLAGSPQKLDLVKSLGADIALNYNEPGWVQQVYAATGGQGVNAVLDSVGGEVGGQAFGALARGGRMVVFGGASGKPLPFGQMMGLLSIKRTKLPNFAPSWSNICRLASCGRSSGSVFRSNRQGRRWVRS
jgi:NADPH:quinone reductase